MALPDGVKGILLDIEGTTTPVSFVYDVLFPFARERLDEFCARADQSADVAGAIELLRGEWAAEKDASGDVPGFGNGARYARHLMDADRKSTALKKLQGLIWEAGYREGLLKGAIFGDVREALELWRDAGIRLRIFSSGSVLAQKLLFGHTPAGDLTPFFEGFHDTTTGPKKEERSYRAIAGNFALPPTAILFLSDNREELDAAAAAAMKTGLMRRPGNPPAEAGPHPVFSSFSELLPE